MFRAQKLGLIPNYKPINCGLNKVALCRFPIAADGSPSDVRNDDVRHEREWQLGDEGSRAEMPIGPWLHSMTRTARGILTRPMRIAIAAIPSVRLR
jgi:hypothetical protein